MIDLLLAGKLSPAARRTFCRLVIQDMFPSRAGDALRDGGVDELIRVRLVERLPLDGMHLRITDFGRRAWVSA